jgi:hypothetical protein
MKRACKHGEWKLETSGTGFDKALSAEQYFHYPHIANTFRSNTSIFCRRFGAAKSVVKHKYRRAKDVSRMDAIKRLIDKSGIKCSNAANWLDAVPLCRNTG